MRLLAIDGNSIMNRAYYGIRVLTNSRGVHTNALFGFMNIYLKNISEVKPDCVAVAFDLKSPTFRHKAVASYKANRKGMPQELAEQMPLIKDMLKYMGVKILECEGFEADDILGTLSRMCCDSGNECFILTGDRDSLQLVNECVTVRLATTRETIVYTPEKFTEDYGFPPIQLIDLKALMGDSSDNISGVSGIGEKTASTLIKEWGTVENLYAHLDEAKLTKSVRSKLENGKAAAEESKWLATIKLDVPIGGGIENYKIGDMETEKLQKLLSELEMYKLLERLSLSAVETEQEASAESREISITEKELTKDIISVLEKVDYIFDGERLSVIDGETAYTSGDRAVIAEFLSSGISKRTFGAKEDYKLCFEYGRELSGLEFDAEIAAYLLDASASEYKIEKLCRKYSVPYYSSAGKYADIASLPELCDALRREIEEQGMLPLMNDIEQPLTEVLAAMEFTGVKVDIQGVKYFGEELDAEVGGIRDSIYEMCGHEFNIASPKQLGTVLFEELGLPAKKKTKSGYSTNAEVLEELRSQHPIIDLVLRYRQLTKLSSTYVEGLLKTVESDGRIHTNFKQTETRTGRISSTEPNLQNIPVRTELGREMRKFFVSDNGKVFLDADYSQIELRILAHVCGDENMQRAFREGEDIHAATASQVFDMPQDMVTSQMRSAAKAVNFGIIYGIGAFSLSKDIGVSVYEAKKYISGYLAKYPKVEKFMNSTVENAVRNGYVTTMFGRKRYIPELSASNKMMQAAGKRIAMNTPIQGTAADIIKIAMVRVYRRLKEEVPDARLILQVHDELIVECSREDSEKASEILCDEMVRACDLAVPLTADVNIGESWYDAKG